MYPLRKFPNFDKEEWISTNSEAVATEISSYEGLFKEHELDNAFRDLIIEHMFLRYLTDRVSTWRGDFVRYVLDLIQSAEGETQKAGARTDLQHERVSTLKAILEWL
jgi:hypothetical protein